MRIPLFFVSLGSLALFAAIFFAVPLHIAEAGVVPCGLSANDPATTFDETEKCTLCHFIVGINEIIKLLRNIMSAIAIVVVVAMSFVYITSAGDEGRMRFAKGGITAALVGFAIVLLAWLIVNFVLTLDIFSSSGLIKNTWDTFVCDTKSMAG